MASFEEVYRAHVQAVYRFAFTVAGRKEDAEDLTSEAFLALYRNFAGIDQSQLPAWLITVVRNRARDWWRHQEVEKRHAAEEQRLAQDPAGPPSREVEDVERFILESPDLKPVHRACLML